MGKLTISIGDNQKVFYLSEEESKAAIKYFEEKNDRTAKRWKDAFEQLKKSSIQKASVITAPEF